MRSVVIPDAFDLSPLIIPAFDITRYNAEVLEFQAVFGLNAVLVVGW
ncbi:MAG: hypothetical protein GY903_13080 [Fuerstiella sp.]|nr:hypothetical protein [Fuerstiella sp.]MCP4855419.1 hypothetical protein [Fuerstiella sp.]